MSNPTTTTLFEPSAKPLPQEADSPYEGHHRLWRILLAIGIVLALHIPFLLPREKVEEVKKDSQSTLSVVVRENIASHTPKGRLFWDQVHYLDSTQWFYPTRNGFSKFNVGSPFPAPAPFPTYSLSKVVLPQQDFPESHLSVVPFLPVPEHDLLGRPCYVVEPIKEKASIQPCGPRWRRGWGGVLEDPPQLTEEEKNLMQSPDIQKKLSSSCIPTRLEVQFRPDIAPNMLRVLLRQSCGATELDQIAIRAIRRQLDEKMADLKKCAPLEGLFLEIDWRL